MRETGLGPQGRRERRLGVGDRDALWFPGPKGTAGWTVIPPVCCAPLRGRRGCRS
jgi:hypothetical protein